MSLGTGLIRQTTFLSTNNNMMMGMRPMKKVRFVTTRNALTRTITNHPQQQLPPLLPASSRRHGTLLLSRQGPQQRPSRGGAGRLLTPSLQRRKKASLASDMAAKGAAGYTSPRTVHSFSFMEALESFLRKTRTIPIPRWITPRHYTITVAEVLGHSSFLLVALSYSVDDFLMLRCIAVVGSTAMLFFTYYQ